MATLFLKSLWVLMVRLKSSTVGIGMRGGPLNLLSKSSDSEVGIALTVTMLRSQRKKYTRRMAEPIETEGELEVGARIMIRKYR